MAEDFPSTDEPSSDISTESRSLKAVWRWNYTNTTHLKCHIVILYGSIATVLPYTSLQAYQLGIDTPFIGVMIAVVPVITVLATAFVAQLGTRVTKLKLAMVIIALGQSTCHMLTLNIPPMEHHPHYRRQVEQFCSDDNRFLNICLPGPVSNYTDLCTGVRIEGVPEEAIALVCYVECGCFCKSEEAERTCLVKESVLVGCAKSICMVLDIPQLPFLCNRDIFPTCDLSCTRSPSLEEPVIPSNASRQLKLSFWSRSFWRTAIDSREVLMFIGLRLTGIVLSGVAVTLTSTVTHLILSETGEKNGTQRFWGNAGWSVLSLVTGHLNHLASKEKRRIDFSSAMYLMTGMNVLDVLVICSLRIPLEQPKPQVLLSSSYEIYRTVRTTVYLSLSFLMGSLSGVIWVYGPLRLRIMGAHPVIVGASMTAQGIGSEITNLLLTRRIIKSVGLGHAVSVSMVGTSIRLLAYGTAFAPWMCLPTELAQGLTLGLFVKVATALVSMESEEGAERRIHQVVSTMYHGVGACFGASVAGCVIYIFGWTPVYTSCSVIALVGSFAHLLYYRCSAAAVSIGETAAGRDILVTFAPNTRHSEVIADT